MKPYRFLLLASFVLCCAASSAMQLGGNFWNLAWHKPSDCFRDFQKVAGENPWNPQFLKEIAIYRSLRFMDWDNTNGSERERWSQRPQRDQPKQNPVAYEWMIDLCNRNQSDLWLTVPHRTIDHSLTNAPSDYALRLCILAKTGIDMRDVDLKPILPKLSGMQASDFLAAGGIKACEPLDPRLRVYVEYSNETWNGIFKQAHYCIEEGTALGLDTNRWTAGFRYHAWAAIRLFRAADLVFGENSPSVVKVLASHVANSWVTEQHLKLMENPVLNPWRVKATAVALAPYYGHKVDGASPDAAEQLRDDIKRCAAQSEKQLKLAKAAGLKLIAYEGGQHVTTQAKLINQNPVMFDLYREYLLEMSKYYDHFCHYAHVGQAGDRGAWGSIEFTGEPLNEAHKYRALAEWAQRR